MERSSVAALFVACVVWAQAPVPPPADAPRNEAPKNEPEQPPALQNNGKPMLVPFQCSDDDMQWAGMSCTEEEPCPVYLEVVGVETVGNRILAMENIHTRSTTLYSVLLGSEDAGTTWREPYERMRGATLDHIQFVDYQNGWISGQTLVPVARDPFLLITSDGGKTWRLRSVLGEGSDGAILQFWFDSPANGSLVIDRMESTESSRYELYETPNGGETWMIRRTSDAPITLKRAASGANSAGWRVEARSKSFAIEKRQGERWSTVASFLVEIGECKPAPRPAASPPPEPAEATPPAPPKPARPRAPSLKRPPPK